MAYYSAKIYYMNPVMEMPSGKGFANVIYDTQGEYGEAGPGSGVEMG